MRCLKHIKEPAHYRVSTLLNGSCVPACKKARKQASKQANLLSNCASAAIIC
jgi:hypothetical protein